MRQRPNRITPKINYADLIKPLSEKAETQVSWVGGYISNVQKQESVPVSPTPTPSITPTQTITPTPTLTPTPSITPTQTITPTPTLTPTPSSTPIPPILDTYTALEGYSLNRKLKSDATNSFRVRRSSDNSEQDIGFVGDLVNISSLTSFIGASSGYVTTIYDQTGNNRDFTQTSLTKQPIVISGGTLLEYNGFIYCQYDAIDDEHISTTTATTIQDLFVYSVGDDNMLYSINSPQTRLGSISQTNWGFSNGERGTNTVILNSPPGNFINVSQQSSNTDIWAVSKHTHKNLTLNPASVIVERNGVVNTITYVGGASKVRRGTTGGSIIFDDSKFQEIIIGSTDSDAVKLNQRDFYNYY
jgi:hypothetical protein